MRSRAFKNPSEQLEAKSPRVLSSEDRIALSNYVVRNDKSSIFFGLGAERFVPSDFLVSSKVQDPLLAYTPLELAAQNQYWLLLSWMLSALPILVNVVDEEEREHMRFVFSKVLLITTFYKQADMVTTLLSLGADPNRMLTVSGKFSGYGPLHFSVYHQSESLITQLMEAGADQTVASVDAPSALDLTVSLARQNEIGYWHLIPLLTPKIQSLASESNMFVREAYARVLLYATVYNQLYIAKHLLSVEADPGLAVVKSGQFSGYTTLHFAFHHNNKELAFHLLAAGADPDLTADNGATFRSLVGNYDPDLANILSMASEKRIEMAGCYIKEFPEAFSENILQATSTSSMSLSSAISLVRKKFFCFFNIGSFSKEVESLQYATTQQQVGIKENAERIRVHDAQIETLEDGVSQSKQQKTIPTQALASCSILSTRARRPSTSTFKESSEDLPEQTPYSGLG